MPVVNQVIPSPAESTEEGPCNWPIELACVPEWATYPPGVQSAAASWAVYILWALTGRQYGPCSVSLRPCSAKCGNVGGYVSFPVGLGGTTGGMGPWVIPWIDNGVWRNCGCTGGCSCKAPCEVMIPGPVAFIDEVRVDGAVVPSTAYRLDSYRGIPVLVRIDGECWPECQDVESDIDEPGAFSIMYQRGVAVPRAGQLAAGELAREFARACSGADCALPQQLASLSRNGVEVQVADPTSLFENGLTGIANVDLFIKAVNPYRRGARARVYSPDAPAVRYSG